MDGATNDPDGTGDDEVIKQVDVTAKLGCNYIEGYEMGAENNSENDSDTVDPKKD